MLGCVIGGSLRTRRIIPKKSIMAVHAKSQLRSEACWSDAKPELLPRVGGRNRHFMAERKEAMFRERLSRKIAVVIRSTVSRLPLYSEEKG